MRRFIAACATAAVCALPASVLAADPSASCNSGIIPPSSSPAGAGIRATTEPMAATVTACSTQAPLPGHARVRLDVSDPSILIVADGDPAANAGGCTDGYTAARVDGTGPSLYHQPDGGYTSRARAKSPAEIADSAVKHCTLAPASA
ncbi:MAG TPA: hypothetical protein VM841_05520 [Actinomycetota bacterium]|nr:hypothetical protein [Actinomycetota bacterium]